MASSRFSLVLASVLAAAPCLADPSPAERVVLVYRAPESCPERASLVEAVAARLGEDPFVDVSPWVVEVTITPESKKLAANVSLRRDGQPLERKLRAGAHECGDLVGAVAVTLAVLLEPRNLSALAERAQKTSPAAATPERPALSAKHEASSAAEDPFQNDERVAPERERGARRAVRASAGGHAALGAAPKPNAGLDAALGIRIAEWSLDVGARADLPRSDVDADGTGVSAAWLAASLAGCRHFGSAVGCALVLAGQVRGEGIGVPPPDRHSTWFFAAGLRAGLELPLDPTWAFTLSADGLVVPTRTTQRIGSEPRWTSPMFSGALGIGVRAEIK